MPLVTEIDIQLLRTRRLLGVSEQAILKIESAARKIDQSLWVYELAFDQPLYEISSQIKKGLAEFIERFMSNVRSAYKDPTYDLKQLSKLALCLDKQLRELDRCESLLAYDLKPAIQKRVGSLLYDVCVENHARVRENWDQVNEFHKSATKTILTDILAEVNKRITRLHSSAHKKSAKTIGPIHECSEETIRHLQQLAKHDNSIDLLLRGDICYCAELVDSHILDVLSKFPHRAMRVINEYVVFTINGRVLLILNDWCISSDRELLEKLTSGEVPKVSSTKLTTKWTFHRSKTEIQTPVGYTVLRITFTSNAQKDPDFQARLRELKATPCGKNTWDVPFDPATDMSHIKNRLKVMFGYPAQVVQLLDGPGVEVLRRNFMSKISSAMPLFAIKPVAKGLAAHRTEVAWVVRDKDNKVYARYQKRSTAKSRIASWAESLESISTSTKVTVPDTKLLDRLSRLSRKSTSIATFTDRTRVVADFLVLHPADFVYGNGVFMYQPKVGEVIYTADTGVATVTNVDNKFTVWLTLKTQDGQQYQVSFPDIMGRQVKWQPGGSLSNPFHEDNSVMPVTLLTQEDVAMPVDPGTVFDEGAGDKFQFSGPTMQSVQTFIPLPEDAIITQDGQISNNGRLLTPDEIVNYAKQPGAAPRLDRNATSRQRVWQAPGSAYNMGVKDPLTENIQLTGYNPAFRYPLDEDAITAKDPKLHRKLTSSEKSSSSEAQDYGGPPESSQNPGNITSPIPGSMEYETRHRGPTPNIANLDIVQQNRKTYLKLSKQIRDSLGSTSSTVHDLVVRVADIAGFTPEANEYVMSMKHAAFELKHSSNAILTQPMRQRILTTLIDLDEYFAKFE